MRRSRRHALHLFLPAALLIAPSALAAPPANDFCSAPQSLPLAEAVSGTQVEAKNDYQIPSGCFTGVGQTPLPAVGRDVVYRFVAPEAGSYSFRVDGTATTEDVVLYVAGSCPTTGTPPITVTSCIAAANRTTGGGAETTACLALTSGQTVYVYADAATFSAGSTFTIEATRCTGASEPNDAPASALPLGCGIEGSISPGGDVDMFLVGMPAPGSRLFALTDGAAANSSDFDLRVTTATDTLEYDDADNDARHGLLAPNIAGRQMTGATSYLRIRHRTGLASEPYRLFSALHAPGAPTPETEPNDTVAQSDGSPRNYFSGAIGTTSDVDHFRFTVRKGDVVFVSLDADPGRNLTPFEPALALLDSAGVVLASVDDPNAVSSNASGAGTLDATTPHSPGEGVVYRARADGTLHARVTGLPGDYILSVAMDCRTLPATDLALSKAASPACVAAGGSLTYTLTVVNQGTTPARNVLVTDPLPAAVAFVSATPSQGSCRGTAMVFCHLGDIAPTASATVSIAVIANTSGTIVNTAAVTAASADDVGANDTASVTTNGACNDGSVCTTGDTCQSGVCTGTPIDCNDGNPCTDDGCVATSGCRHDANSAPCDDGNSCSVGDRCAGGACHGGPCHGTCAGGKECAQNRYEQCVCVDPSTSCGGTSPACDGECPAGQRCTAPATGAPCTCTPRPVCGAADGPYCAGFCPSGQRCVTTDSPTGPDCVCEPETSFCEVSSAPVCDGECPAGYACAAQGAICRCLPSTPLCGNATAPRCAGGCPLGQSCRPDASGACVCFSLDVACGGSAPVCDGRCPGEDERCAPGTGGSCVCAERDCVDRTFPECGGPCPNGKTCRPDTQSGTCVCDPNDTPCATSAFPECGGTCPTDQFCEPDTSSGGCVCEGGPVPCGSAAFPTCDGECPGDELCVTGTGGSCVCLAPTPDCAAAPAPACGGTCNDGSVCHATIDGASCECQPLPVDCGDAQAPFCNGDCQLGAMCLPSGGGRCACTSCALAAPAPLADVRFVSKTRLEWYNLDCATSYNVYRHLGPLTDANGDGLADSYGTCLAAGSIESRTTDTSSPPPGSLHSYLVTGENGAGEGSLGRSSAGLERPNVTPCP